MFYYSATLFLWQHSIIHQLLDSIEAAPLVLWNIKRINICCILTVSGLCIIYSLLACKTVRTCEGMEYQSQSRVQLELPNLGNIRSVMEIKYSFRSFTLRTRETMIPGCWQLSRLRIQTSMALHELSTNGPFSSPTSRTRNIRKWDDLTTIQSVEEKRWMHKEKNILYRYNNQLRVFTSVTRLTGPIKSFGFSFGGPELEIGCVYTTVTDKNSHTPHSQIHTIRLFSEMSRQKFTKAS